MSFTGKPPGFSDARKPLARHSMRVAKLSARISSGWMMNEELRSISGIQFVLPKLDLIRSPLASRRASPLPASTEENDVQRVEEILEQNDFVQRQQRLNYRHDVDALGPGLNGQCVQVLERVRVAEAAVLELGGVFESVHGLESKKRIERIPQ